MTNQLWSATVDRIGEFTPEMFDGGCYILFGDPVPDALAEVSIVHGTREAPARDLRAGDILELGGVELRLDEVGNLANPNLTELGHAVVYVNSPGQALLPGAIKATGTSRPQPTVGSPIRFLGD